MSSLVTKRTDTSAHIRREDAGERGGTVFSTTIVESSCVRSETLVLGNNVGLLPHIFSSDLARLFNP